MESVLTCADLGMSPLRRLLARYDLVLSEVAPGAPIPGTYWGEPEAGVVGTTIHVRGDTPVHSALHESCHVICMDEERRAGLHTDAGGTVLEECGVCYLQIRLADHLPGVGSERLMDDMDRWGYSFRLGSTRAWHDGDAEDALAWLQQHDLLDQQQEPLWRLRR